MSQKQNTRKLPEYTGPIPPGPKETSWAVLFGRQEGFTLGCSEACPSLPAPVLGRTLGIIYAGDIVVVLFRAFSSPT